MIFIVKTLEFKAFFIYLIFKKHYLETKFKLYQIFSTKNLKNIKNFSSQRNNECRKRLAKNIFKNEL